MRAKRTDDKVQPLVGDGTAKKTKVFQGGVYCVKCGAFLGMTCDPFRAAQCDTCFPVANG